MSDEFETFFAPTSRPKQWNRIIAEARSRAELLLETAPTCVVCHQRITTRGRRATHHHSCEPGTLVGKICHCATGCTDQAFGDGSTECEPSCVPCQSRRGQRLGGRHRASQLAGP